ncbi:MAG: winged helix-turn-helix transcriptional regulator [Candidatus Brockarchaeota archaeon]|nr:winged helix-turn-helix transcriptional regulator [Candidatus Brockarchaeota archaeon]
MERDDSIRRAGLFDVLAHPVRIRILKVLQQEPMGFSELKRALGMESSGHLQYHLERLRDLVKQDAYGKYVISDDGREALRFTQLVEQMSVRKSRMLNILSLVVIVVLLSAVTIPEIHRVASRQIPLYENLDLSEDFVTVGGLRFRYLLVTASELENGTKIVFRGVVFTYLASTILRLHECFYGNTPVSAVEMFSAGVKVEYEDGSFEIIPILPWTRDGGEFAQYVLKQGNMTIIYSPFSCREKLKALALRIGPQTIALLVRAE